METDINIYWNSIREARSSPSFLVEVNALYCQRGKSRTIRNIDVCGNEFVLSIRLLHEQYWFNAAYMSTQHTHRYAACRESGTSILRIVLKISMIPIAVFSNIFFVSFFLALKIDPMRSRKGYLQVVGMF